MKTLADDRGETLVELMITIVIMAIGVTAVVAALFTTVVGSDVHHSLSQGEVLARDYGEAIKVEAIDADSYTACPDEDDLTPTSFDNTLAGPGWQAEITKVEWWDGTSPTTFTFTDVQTACQDKYDACVAAPVTVGFAPACDSGFQRVTYRVWNSRTDAAKTEVFARVLTRRNDADLPAAP